MRQFEVFYLFKLENTQEPDDSQLFILFLENDF
jgi:hypothetical protein